jgi:hypothetical protein
MSRRSLQVLTGGVLALALVVMGAGFPAKTVPPKKWANSVCSAVGDWVHGTQAGATALQTKVGSQGNDIAKVKKALVAYLAATAKGTTRMSDQLEHAGTPDTPKGKQAAKGLADGFAKIHAAVSHFKTDAEHVSTSSPIKATAALTKLSTKINTQFGQLNRAFGDLGKYDPNHKLAKAFKATQACKALN